MDKIKIVCIYQVIMHYRLPFYIRINEDQDYIFTLIYGRGKKNSKLENTNIESSNLNAIMLKDYRIPLPFTPSLFSNLKKLDPDIVFSEGASSLINSSIAFIYAKLFKKKFVWWSLGTLKNSKKTGLRDIISIWESYIERNSDAIFTYSTQGKNYFKEKGISEDKIFVAVNVFDTNKKLLDINSGYEENFIDKNYFNIGFIGTIQKTKNLELLIEVVKKLNNDIEDKFRLHIIGDGNHFENLNKYIDNDKSIILYGRMNSGASKILKNCNIMVLPGLGGLAIVEGMLNGLPIIAGNADGTELDLVDERNGIILEEMNFQNLYNQLKRLYHSPEELKQMGENSFYKITNEFSFNNYYDVFKRMINYLNEKLCR